MQTHTEHQCQHRWYKVLDPELIKGAWTKEEDEKVGDTHCRFCFCLTRVSVSLSVLLKLSDMLVVDLPNFYSRRYLHSHRQNHVLVTNV